MTKTIPIQPPKIQTYHCLCTSLLLATTHTLSLLPRRRGPGPGLDNSFILPLPSSPPSFSNTNSNPNTNPTPTPNENEESENDMPTTGYTTLLSLTPSPASKTVIVRREDGFEKRQLWRCGRCGVVVGYEIVTARGGEMEMDVDGTGYTGRVMYILPGGVVGTDDMVRGRRVGEGDVDVLRKGCVGVFE